MFRLEQRYYIFLALHYNRGRYSILNFSLFERSRRSPGSVIETLLFAIHMKDIFDPSFATNLKKDYKDKFQF